MGGMCTMQEGNGGGWVSVKRVQTKGGEYRISTQITRYVDEIEKILSPVSHLSSSHQHILLYSLYRHQYPTTLSTTQVDIARVYAYLC